jgi:hypothetical protein
MITAPVADSTERCVTVLKECGELGPLTQRVPHCLAEQTLWQYLRRNRLEPDMKIVDDRRRMFGANVAALFRSIREILIPQ